MQTALPSANLLISLKGQPCICTPCVFIFCHYFCSSLYSYSVSLTPLYFMWYWTFSWSPNLDCATHHTWKRKMQMLNCLQILNVFFPKKSWQIAFISVVYPALVLAYMGQAAFISQHHNFESSYHIGFYVSVPGSFFIFPCLFFLYKMVLLK